MIQDVELKKNIAASRPHTLWLKEQVLTDTKLFCSQIILRYYIMYKYLLAVVCVYSDHVISSCNDLINSVQIVLKYTFHMLSVAFVILKL